MWRKTLQVCRAVNYPVLWATLAALASKQNEIEISEEAYSAAIQIDKVNYLQYIKSLPKSSPEQVAENSIMNGRFTEAEVILMNNHRIKEAIDFCLRMHRWDRSIELANKSNDNDLINNVLTERKKYLIALGKEEWSTAFLNVGNTETRSSYT